MTMNADKAYIFGMVIGGGIWGNAKDYFHIRLPFKQWGSYLKNPQRAAQITRDVMNLNNMFSSVYGITIQYDTDTGGVWNVLCEGDTSELRSDLAEYGVPCEGEMRKNTSITEIIKALTDDFMKRRFIAGLADTIGSTAPSQRRFTDDKQIISFEISGFNFSFVCDLCRLLYSINCLPDQILWNHPNFHSPKNPYYKSWKKGFKLRVLLDQYAQFGAFAFKTKAESSNENLQLQQQKNNAIPCPWLNVSASVSCVHPAEHDEKLPSCIRGGHYLHNRHVCAVLGCENAPYEAIKELFANVGELVNPFPILCKDKIENIENIISSDPLLANRNYQTSNSSVKFLYKEFQSSNNVLLYGNKVNTGYPLNQIIQGIAFIIADDNEIGVTRIKGKYTDLIERRLASDPNLSVELQKPDLLTPLVIIGNGRGALIGARNPEIYKNLVSVSPDNEFVLLQRGIYEMRNEISYYPEIQAFIGAQLKSDFLASSHRELFVYWGIGELKTNLQRIISEHPNKCACAIKFAKCVPPLNLDIFALITDGDKFELLILEIKLVKSVGLSEWSQLVGYCLVSGAKYGLLVNVDSGGSPRLTQILHTERHISHIQTVVNNELREHLLGFMQWNSTTNNFEYSNLGLIKSLSELSKRLTSEFIK